MVEINTIGLFIFWVLSKPPRQALSSLSTCPVRLLSLTRCAGLIASQRIAVILWSHTRQSRRNICDHPITILRFCIIWFHFIIYSWNHSRCSIYFIWASHCLETLSLRNSLLSICSKSWWGHPTWGYAPFLCASDHFRSFCVPFREVLWVCFWLWSYSSISLMSFLFLAINSSDLIIHLIWAHIVTPSCSVSSAICSSVYPHKVELFNSSFLRLQILGTMSCHGENGCGWATI